MTSTATKKAPKTRPYALIVAVFLIIEVTGVFEQTMMLVAIPTLMGVFQMDAAEISWAVTIFLLVGAGTAAIAGRLGDLYGRRKVMIILMLISAVGSFISVIAGNFEGILVGRALQGTSAALFPLLVGIAREVVPAKKVPVLVSITTGSAIIGGSIAALIAGILIDTSGWHSIFTASGILAILALGSCLLLPPSTIIRTESKARMDILGAVLLAPAIALILFGVNTARAGFSPATLALLGGGAILFAFWVYWELRVKNPMFNLRLFKQSALVMALIATAFISIGIVATGSLLNPIIKQGSLDNPVGVGLTPTQSGLYGLIGGAVGFILSPVGGRIAARFGAKITLGIGIGITVLGFLGYLVGPNNLFLAVSASIVVGVGLAQILAGLPNLIVEAVPPAVTGEAVGMVYSVGRTIFAAIGTVIAGIILASDVVPGTTAPTYGAWTSSIVFVFITAALAMVVVILTKKVKPMDERGDVIEALAEAQGDPVEGIVPAATAAPVAAH